MQVFCDDTEAESSGQCFDRGIGAVGMSIMHTDFLCLSCGHNDMLKWRRCPTLPHIPRPILHHGVEDDAQCPARNAYSSREMRQRVAGRTVSLRII